MTDADLNRIRDHLAMHQAKPRRDAMQGDIDWAYIRFAAWALPILEHVGAYGVAGDGVENRPVPGAEAVNARTP